MNPILLDTHAAIWGADGRLTAAVTKVVDAAAERGELLISPVSAWEIGLLVRKGRLTLAMGLQDYVRALFTRRGVVTATLTPQIAVTALTLSGRLHDDPADRLLIATAASYGAQFVTRDKRIRDYAKATRQLRCIAC